MKEETKELIKWAMSLIADYRVQNMVEHSNFRKNTPAAQNSETEIKNCKDFAEFLNSLPEIESHLCRGGYIQDKNGTPCCDGDKILFNNRKAFLFWSKVYSRFFVKLEDSVISNDCRAFLEKDIEKVENINYDNC